MTGQPAAAPLFVPISMNTAAAGVRILLPGGAVVELPAANGEGAGGLELDAAELSIALGRGRHQRSAPQGLQRPQPVPA